MNKYVERKFKSGSKIETPIIGLVVGNTISGDVCYIYIYIYKTIK